MKKTKTMKFGWVNEWKICSRTVMIWWLAQKFMRETTKKHFSKQKKTFKHCFSALLVGFVCLVKFTFFCFLLTTDWWKNVKRKEKFAKNVESSAEFFLLLSSSSARKVLFAASRVIGEAESSIVQLFACRIAHDMRWFLLRFLWQIIDRSDDGNAVDGNEEQNNCIENALPVNQLLRLKIFDHFDCEFSPSTSSSLRRWK